MKPRISLGLACLLILALIVSLPITAQFNRMIDRIIFEGVTPDAFETTVSVTDPTADRTVLIPDADVTLTGGTMINTITATANETTASDGGGGNWTVGIADPLIVGKGGTGAATLTDGGILLGSGTGAVTALGVAANGQIPVGDGTTDPVLATLTGTANELDVSNGPGTITLGIVDPLIVAKGGTGAATLTDGGLLLGSGTGAVTALGVASNGQIPIGDGTTDPVLAALTQGSGITVTNGAGSITVASTLGTSVDLAAEITGTLPVGNGGTGTATVFTAGSVVFAGASGAYTEDNAGLSYSAGTVTMGAASNPSIRLDEAASGTSFTDLIDANSANAILRKTCAAGNCIMDLEALPADGTSAAQFRFFRNTNTTGDPQIQIHKGNGTSTVIHSIRGNFVEFNLNEEDRDFIVNGTVANTLFLDAGSNRVGISTASPSAVLEVNGDLEITTLEDNDGSNFFDGAAPAGSFVTDIDSSGAFTTASNAATATALAANGANCSANNFAAGVDASGAAEGCDVPPIADALTANGANCTGDQLMVNGGVDASGAAEGCDSNLTFSSTTLTVQNHDVLVDESGATNDPEVTLSISTDNWVLCADNSDLNRFKISYGSCGAAATGIEMASDGTVTLGNDLNLTGQLVLDGSSAIDIDFQGGILAVGRTNATDDFRLGFSGGSWDDVQIYLDDLHVFGLATGLTGNSLAITSGGIVYEDTSSARFKKGIGELKIDPKKVLDLPSPKSYINEGGYEDFNFIAEEVAEVAPLLTTYDSDGATPRGVRIDRMVPLLVEIVKAQDARISRLEAALKRASAFEGRPAALGDAGRAGEDESAAALGQRLHEGGAGGVEAWPYWALLSAAFTGLLWSKQGKKGKQDNHGSPSYHEACNGR